MRITAATAQCADNGALEVSVTEESVGDMFAVLLPGDDGRVSIQEVAHVLTQLIGSVSTPTEH